MGGHLEVDQLATVMADEEEDVEGLKGQALDDKKVGLMGTHIPRWVGYPECR
jgi:hypothetical protein